MKFSSSISTLCVALSLVSQVTGLSISSEDALVARQRNQNQNQGQKAAQAQAAAAAAAKAKANQGANNKNNQQAAAAAAAANQGKNNNNNNGNANNNTANNGNNAANNGNNAAANNGDPQQSLTLDPKVIATGFANNGQDVPTAGQVASLTSKNNFINFCLTVPNLPITNGQQITTGSCNPAPIGVIPSVDNMPSAKFEFPVNTGTVPANAAFTIKLNAKNIELGNFVNAKENYFAAPQTVNNQGQIVGHTHVVVEQLQSLTQTTPTNPKNFAFFKGVDNAAVNGQVQVAVSAGVPPGAYRLCTINSSSNHQPVIVPIAQHGSLDDCIYFTAVNGGGNGNAAAGAANNATAAAGQGAQNNGQNAGQNAGKNGQAANGQAANGQAANNGAAANAGKNGQANNGAAANTGKNGQANTGAAANTGKNGQANTGANGQAKNGQAANGQAANNGAAANAGKNGQAANGQAAANAGKNGQAAANNGAAAAAGQNAQNAGKNAQTGKNGQAAAQQQTGAASAAAAAQSRQAGKGGRNGRQQNRRSFMSSWARHH